MSTRLERYAELAVRVGANVQPGQLVDVVARVEHAYVAREVARASYRAGAAYVDVLYSDQHVRRAMLRQSTLGAHEATALVITHTQQAGLQPPKYAFVPPKNKIKKNRHPCRSCTSSFDVSVEQQLSSEPERQTDIHLNPKGQTKCDSWSSSKPRKTPKKKAHSPIPSSWPT